MKALGKKLAVALSKETGCRMFAGLQYPGRSAAQGVHGGHEVPGFESLQLVEGQASELSRALGSASAEKKAPGFIWIRKPAATPPLTIPRKPWCRHPSPEPALNPGPGSKPLHPPSAETERRPPPRHRRPCPARPCRAARRLAGGVEGGGSEGDELRTPRCAILVRVTRVK